MTFFLYAAGFGMIFDVPIYSGVMLILAALCNSLSKASATPFQRTERQ